MPFLDTDDGKAYYRHWAAAKPRAVVIFLHGFGEHTGVYHRYGFALNAADIDLWAVDQFGHGLSPGERGDFGSLEASVGLADQLAALAQAETPGIPLVLQGHSFGAVVTLSRLIAGADPYHAGVISGAPLVPIAGLLDADSSFDLDPSWLSADPFGVSLARELDRAWDRFGAELPKLAVPTLAVHGSDDPIADIGAVRAYAEQIEPLRLEEIAGGRHDILNDVTHQAVSDTIIEFVLGVASS
jgi:alpha-beta hydrolase superfamily lysophospholipase